MDGDVESKKSSLMNLNIDCQLLVLDELDVLSMLSLSATNEHFSHLIENILKRKFLNKSITITGAGRYATEVQESEKDIRISHLPEVLWLIKNYCHLISHLKIENFDVNGTDSVYKYANQYCSKSLTQIHFENFYPNVFDEFSMPFENVESVTLTGAYNKLHGSKMRLDQIFPAMRQLSMGMVEIADDKWMDHNNFGNLDHFGVLIWLYNQSNHLTENVIVQFMEKYPEIQSLRLENVSPKFLQIVANKMPSLENLDIQFNHVKWTSEQINNIHFEHLKSLKVKQVSQLQPNQMVFEDLEELDTDANASDFEKWINLIKNNEHLKKLRISRPLKNNEFQQMSDACINLTDLSLATDKDVEDESIRKIFEHCGQLEQVHLALPPNSSFNTISKSFANEWIVRDNEVSLTIDFQRKN